MKSISPNLAQAFRVSEYIFAVSACAIFTGAVIPLLITQGASEGDGIDLTAFNYASQNMLRILVYVVSTCLIFLRWEKFLFYASQSFGLIMLIALVPMSTLWSMFPESTLNGAINFIGVTLFGIYLGSRFTTKEQLRVLALTCGIIALLSFLFIFLLPDYGVMGGVHAGASRGVFTHKNGMGRFMVLSASVFMLMLKTVDNRRHLVWLGLAFSLVLTIMSESIGSLLNSIALITFILSTSIFKLKPMTIVPTILLAIFASLIYEDLATPILEFFERDFTFTGRTEIWPLVIDKIQERPILGYGFNAFWRGTSGDSAYVIRALRWNVPDSHNGFLDLVLAIGLVGLSIFVVVFWSTLLKSVVVFSKDSRWENLWPVILLAYLVIVNFSESGLLGGFVWILFVAVVVSTGIKYKQLVDVS